MVWYGQLRHVAEERQKVKGSETGTSVSDGMSL